MSRDEAKRALETIKTIQNDKPDEYSDDLCTTVIERLMKRAVTDYKQLLKDQQDSARQYWCLFHNERENRLPIDHETRKDAVIERDELCELYPDSQYEEYEPKLFREVMDNE